MVSSIAFDSLAPHVLLKLVETDSIVCLLRTNEPAFYPGACVLGSSTVATDRQLKRYEQCALDAMMFAAHELRKGQAIAQISATVEERFANEYLSAVGLGSYDSAMIFQSDRCEYIRLPDHLIRIDTSQDVAVFLLTPQEDISAFDVVGCVVFRRDSNTIAEPDICMISSQTVLPLFHRVTNLHPVTCAAIIDATMFRVPVTIITKENLTHPLAIEFPSGETILAAIWVPFGWIMIHAGGRSAYVIFHARLKTALLLQMLTADGIQFELLIHPGTYIYNTPVVWSSMALSEQTRIAQGNAVMCTPRATESIDTLLAISANTPIISLFSIPTLEESTS